MPARVDELERVCVLLEIARADAQVDELRAAITAEESRQRLVQITIDERLTPLRRDVERLAAEIQRLEVRLERLVFARRALSDTELDGEEQVERAEEAAFWAEWRQQREERRGTVVNRKRPGDEQVQLRQTYRALARLIHPDLARDAADRHRREAVMRLANAAHEAGDVEQLLRLLVIWSRPEDAEPRDVEALRARLAQRRLEQADLRRQLEALAESSLGKLVRRPASELARYLQREDDRLRRDLAALRLRRRRLLSQVEERRRQLAASD